MAEVISVDAPSPSDSVATRTGRHSRVTAEEDRVHLREVSAANAHVAAFGENGKRYGDAASNFNANPTVVQTVTWKSVRDRYKRLQEQFDKSYNANQRLSGVGQVRVRPSPRMRACELSPLRSARAAEERVQ